MARLMARVKYNDFGGTAAADAAHDDLDDFLRNQGLIAENELLVGVELSIGENQGNRLAPPYIRAFLIDGDGPEAVQQSLQADPLELRVVEVNVDLERFLLFFKRLSIVLVRKGADIAGCEYSERG